MNKMRGLLPLSSPRKGKEKKEGESFLFQVRKKKGGEGRQVSAFSSFGQSGLFFGGASGEEEKGRGKEKKKKKAFFAPHRAKPGRKGKKEKDSGSPAPRITVWEGKVAVRWGKKKKGGGKGSFS